jgi:hypothetical protein
MAADSLACHASMIVLFGAELTHLRARRRRVDARATRGTGAD